MDTRIRIPPESCRGKRRAAGVRSTCASAAATRAAASARVTPARSSGRRTLASTRAQGIKVGSWNTKASRRPGTPTPANPVRHHCSRPTLGSIRLAISFSKVDLPQPEGPIRLTNSPGWMVRSIGASARTPLANTLSAPRISTGGIVTGG